MANCRGTEANEIKKQTQTDSRNKVLKYAHTNDSSMLRDNESNTSDETMRWDLLEQKRRFPVSISINTTFFHGLLILLTTMPARDGVRTNLFSF